MSEKVHVTGPTRQEACRSMCKLLLLGMIKNTGKVNNWKTGIFRARQMSAQVNGVVFDRRTISRGLGKRHNPGMRQEIRNQITRQHEKTRLK